MPVQEAPAVLVAREALVASVAPEAIAPAASEAREDSDFFQTEEHKNIFFTAASLCAAYDVLMFFCLNYLFCPFVLLSKSIPALF